MRNTFLTARLSLGRLAGDTAFYGLVAAAGKLSSVLLVPLLARTIPAADFGVLDTFLLAGNALLVLGNAGADSALMFYFYEGSREQQDRYLAGGLWIRVLGGAACALAAILGAGAFTEALTGSLDRSGWLMLAAASVPATLASNYLLDALRIGRRKRPFLWISAARMAVLLGGSAAILLGSGESRVELFLWFRLVPEAAASGVLFLVVGRAHNLLRISPDAVRSMLRYGLPLV
ncbi:MAG: hypothetical protein WB626_06095, partial [Bacteroidota bacterium]